MNRSREICLEETRWLESDNPGVDLRKFGVYRIINKSSGMYYIGKTNGSFLKRFREHIADLNRHQHGNRAIQKDFDVLGIKEFKFEVIEVIDNWVFLREVEMYWIKQFSGKNLYNCIGNRNIETREHE